MKLLIPLFLVLFGVGGGAAAGFFLKPTAEEHTGQETGAKTAETAPDKTKKPVDPTKATHEYVRMNNQFVVPIVQDERVASLVVLSLSVEVNAGQTELVYNLEPKLRDTFLQVLFDHANVGGFRGAFTNSSNLDVLRQALFAAGKKVMGDTITDVLIVEIARQDV